MIEYHENCKNIIKNIDKIYFRAASFCSCARFRCSSFSCSISFCLCICFSISACLRLSCSSLHNRKRGYHRHFCFTRRASLISCQFTQVHTFTLFSPASRPLPSLCALALPAPSSESPATLCAYAPIPLDLSRSSLCVCPQMKSAKRTRFFPSVSFCAKKREYSYISRARTHVPAACLPADRYFPSRFETSDCSDVAV